MASEVKIAVVRGTAPGSNTTKSFTTANLGGLTPKAAIIYCSAIHSGATSPRATAAFSEGFTDGTSQGVSAIACQDAVGTSNTFRRQSESLCMTIINMDATGTVARSAAFSAWVSDGGDGQTGITLTFAGSASTLAYELTIILFAGSGVTVCGCSSFEAANSLDGTVSPALSAEPDLIWFNTTGLDASTLDAGTVHAIMSSGMAHYDGATITQYGVRFCADDNNAGEPAASLITSNGAVGQMIADAITWRGEVTAVGSSSFTMTTRIAASGADRVNFLALSFGDRSSKVVQIDSPTNAAADWAVTTVGFKPQALGLYSLFATALDTIETGSNAATYGVGFVDKNGAESSHECSYQDASGTSQAQSRGSAALLDFSDNTGTQAFLSTSGGLAFDSQGFDLPNANLTTADGTTRKWFAWAVEEEAAAASGGPLFRRSSLSGLGSGGPLFHDPLAA